MIYKGQMFLFRFSQGGKGQLVDLQRSGRHTRPPYQTITRLTHVRASAGGKTRLETDFDTEGAGRARVHKTHTYTQHRCRESRPCARGVHKTHTCTQHRCIDHVTYARTHVRANAGGGELDCKLTWRVHKTHTHTHTQQQNKKEATNRT